MTDLETDHSTTTLPELAPLRRLHVSAKRGVVRPLIGFGAMILGLYLLFQHGCHRDIDDEPGIFLDHTSREKTNK